MERGRHTEAHTHTHTAMGERKKMNQRPSDKGRRGKKQGEEVSSATVRHIHHFSFPKGGIPDEMEHSSLLMSLAAGIPPMALTCHRDTVLLSVPTDLCNSRLTEVAHKGYLSRISTLHLIFIEDPLSS